MSGNSPASRGPEYFAALYAANPDPWDFANSAYEHEKYAETLAALEGRRFRRGFEIGCSIGVFTERLAARCGALLAVDIAEQALAQAARRCTGLAQVEFRALQLPADWPEGAEFDLIVLSEILYFLAPEDVASMALRVGSSIAATGLVVLVNYTGKIEEPCHGEQAAELFIRQPRPRLRWKRHIRRPRFRIDLLEGLT